MTRTVIAERSDAITMASSSSDKEAQVTEEDATTAAGKLIAY